MVLDHTAVPEVVDVLQESFFDYPVMRFVLGESGTDYPERLQLLVRFFVMARVFRGEVILGVKAAEALVGAVLLSRPGGPDPAPEYFRLREEVWSTLGDDARARYGSFAEACAPFQIESPHLHVNMIGVRRQAQGTGVSRRLLDAVHERSWTDTKSVGVTLTTEDPTNVELYRHFGYEVVGKTQVAPGLTSWGFFRADEPRSPSD
jgi:GNAT superfamily N-acetyltransferase